MTDRFFTYLQKKLDRDPIKLDRFLLDYTKDKVEWSTEKRLKYDLNIIRFLLDPSYKNYCGVFKLMVKSGEIYDIDKDVEIKGLIQNVSARPRAIWVPSIDGCGIM